MSPDDTTPVDDYEGIVYDLDGTVVRLAVDWDAVREDVEAIYREAGVDPDGTLWGLVDGADDHGIGDAVEAAVADHEQKGAKTSRRLPIADELAVVDRPAAICSLNCESACRAALEIHDLSSTVDAVVGRDTVPERKPDPAPLVAALDGIGVAPEDAVFVGDSEGDEQAAKRAGVDFQWVTEGRRN